MKRVNGDRVLVGLMVVATALFGFCFTHVCYDGHAAHPPISPWDVLADCVWVALFAGIAVEEILRRRENWLLVTGTVVVVSVSRLVEGSYGGFNIVYEAPLLFGLLLLLAARRRLLARVLPGKSGRLGRALFLVGSGIGMIVVIAVLTAFFIRSNFLLGHGLVGGGLLVSGLLLYRRSVSSPAQQAVD